MKIKKFVEFIKESYLKGGRAPLYKSVSYGVLNDIIRTDMLKMGNPARDRNGKRRGDDQIKSISLTRSSILHYHSVDIVLDTDLLIRDGYIPIPFDELRNVMRLINHKDVNKSNKVTGFKYYKSIKHNLSKNFGNIRGGGLEEEYEERIYKDIKNLGKYIISIDYSRGFELDPLYISYVKKYPHIQFRKMFMKDVKLTSTGRTKISNGKYKVDIDINTIKQREKMIKMRNDQLVSQS